MGGVGGSGFDSCYRVGLWSGGYDLGLNEVWVIVITGSLGWLVGGWWVLGVKKGVVGFEFDYGV